MTSVSPIKIADIETELKNLHEENEELGKIQACLFNLIVYTSTHARMSYFRNILSAVIEKFPCRILFIQHDRLAKDDYLHVTVSSQSCDHGKTPFTCDEILLAVGGKHIERVPFLVSPHLVPDLPIYLLWGEDPTTEHLVLPHFESYASRLIFDTDTTKNLNEFSTAMLKKIDNLEYEIRDISWGLTGPWRDALAQVFNNSDHINQLRQAKSLLIKYNKPDNEEIQHSEMQSVYLQAWLAAQLGWEFQKVVNSEEKITVLYGTGSETTEVTLRPQVNNNLNSGALLNIEISDANITKYELRRDESIRKVIVHVSTINECLLPFSLPLPSVIHSNHFMKEIFYETTSRHYRNMLQQLTLSDWSCLY